MARIVKEEEYSLRRNEILDAAQRLVYTKGYAQMTIQDILDALQISKGAFYHYFNSKGELLEGLINRMIDQALLMLQPIEQDQSLPAIEKLNRYMLAATNWKSERKDFFLALLPVWYADDNILVRQKVTSAGIERLAPLFNGVIAQGEQEGVFCTTNPEQTGEVVLSMMYGMSNKIAEMLLHELLEETAGAQINQTINAYTTAVERVLGAPAGSIVMVEPGIMQEWVDAMRSSTATE